METVPQTSRAIAPLRLRMLDPQVAALANLMAGGRRASLPVAGAWIEVEASAEPCVPLDEAERGRLTLRTRFGAVDLLPGAPLLRLLTGIDLPASDAADEVRLLVMQAAAARVPDAWTRLFSLRSIEYGIAAPPGPAVTLSLRCAEQGWSVAAQLSGPASALCSLLQADGWNGAQSPALDEDRLAIRRSLAIGRATLAWHELRDLACGDAIVIDEPLFDAQGRGAVSFGALRMEGALEVTEHTVLFLFERWSACMNAPEDEPLIDEPDDKPLDGEQPGADAHEEDTHDADHDDAQGVSPAAGPLPASEAGAAGAAGAADVSLDSLPVSLAFEIGVLDMTVGELKRLAAGSVIDLRRPLPPQVIVRCRGTEVARGELVDLGGSMAVQVTQLWNPRGGAPC